MKHFRIGVLFLICSLICGALLLWGASTGFAQGKVNPDPERLVMPTPKLQKGFEEWVGLEKGSGPWADYYKPVPLHMYWSPKNHYIRPDLSAFKDLFGDYASGDCMGCHDKVTPGIVRSWRDSSHAKPRRSPAVAEKTRAIEEKAGDRARWCQ